jgi:predicted nucleic acid-binding protein
MHPPSIRDLLDTIMISEPIRPDIESLKAGRSAAAEFAGRILPFEATTAERNAEIVEAGRQAGNPIERFDALIAATALSASASGATRDTAGFAGAA